MKKACLLLVCMFLFAVGWSWAADMTKLTDRSPETVTAVDNAWQGSSSRAVVWDNLMVYWSLGASQYDSAYPFDATIADDFEFIEDTEVSDVHWIGGYWNGPPDAGFFDWVIIFYQDSAGLGLAPGAIIDSFYFPNASVNETWLSGSAGSSNYYSYAVDLPDTVLFSANTRYWIAIIGYGLYPPQSGWAFDTTVILLHEAVRYSAFFGDLTWTNTTDIFGYPANMCFQLTGMPAEDPIDWGDAPDSYQTLAASNGANHLIVPPMFLGTLIDPEADGQPTATALGDDNNGVPDDEDGVVLTNLVVIGNNVNVKVTASMPGLLDAWVDFNGNGTWGDAGDQIFMAQFLNPGVNWLSFTVPVGAAPGVTYSRWRFSSIGNLTWDGPAPDGEVEDYRVFIQEEMENIKWYQPPDLDNTGMDVDMFYYGVPEFDGLADDFMCTQTGPITDIHFWASFMDDYSPPLPFQIFEITIYADIPAGVYAPWSMPGEILWREYFGPGIIPYVVTQVTDNNPEDYYFGAQQVLLDDNHLNCYQYDFYIDESGAFVQYEDTIYWLGIRDMSWDGQYHFGWKTCEIDARWNDDATWLCDPPAFWCDLHYPILHEYETMSLDLAFALSTEQVCDCVPGEANNDGVTNIFDVTYLISFLYLAGPAPVPYALCNGDPNCDCVCNIFDVTYLISFLYLNGPPPCTCQQWLAACGPPLRK